MLTVGDLLRGKGNAVWAVSPETTVLETMRFLASKNIGALVVLEEGKIAGIISERDFIHSIAQESACRMDTQVRDYMTKEVITVTPENTIQDCMEVMTSKRIRHLPVLKGEELVGLISIGDVVKGIISEQGDMIHNLEKYITGSR